MRSIFVRLLARLLAPFVEAVDAAREESRRKHLASGGWPTFGRTAAAIHRDLVKPVPPPGAGTAVQRPPVVVHVQGSTLDAQGLVEAIDQAFKSPPTWAEKERDAIKQRDVAITVRDDTGEVVEERALTPDERQRSLV